MTITISAILAVEAYYPGVLWGILLQCNVIYLKTSYNQREKNIDISGAYQGDMRIHNLTTKKFLHIMYNEVLKYLNMLDSEKKCKINQKYH